MTRPAHIAALRTVFAIVLLGVLSGTAAAASAAQKVSDIAYSDFLAKVDQGKVRDVTVRGGVITGDLKNGRPFETYAPHDPTLIERLVAGKVEVDAARPDTTRSLLRGTMIDWLPLLLIAAVALSLTQKKTTGSGPETNIRKSRAHLVNDFRKGPTFADVAGIDEAREELAEIVEFLRNPAKFAALGGRIPKGCLLIGPPGTGKTLLARAVAGEAHVPFFTVSGSDFVEIYVGVGASRVRDMFAEAKEVAPSIIFIDEIDAVGGRRAVGPGRVNDEREQTLNQLLVEMDGFDRNERVIVMAATNRADMLDPALLRPGRFDRQVFVPNPDIRGRKEILAVHLRKVPTAADVDIEAIACATPGLSGADLANVVNEAALRAARAGKRQVGMSELEAARERVLLGPERRSVSLTEEERRRIAYHEAGHALVALHVPGNDPLAKVTIVPRGRSLGATLSLPEHDHGSLSQRQMEARIAMLLGGRIAEEIIFGRDGTTNGAADDIRRATTLVRRMVTEFGFSQRLGPLCYARDAAELLEGHGYARRALLSKATSNLIDEEIRHVVSRADGVARRALTAHADGLHRLAQALLEREMLSGAEVAALSGRLDPGGRAEAEFPGHSSQKGLLQ